jgi:hypothetical protein
MALSVHFEDFFDKPSYSRINLIMFAKDHVSKLSVSAATKYSQEIIDTSIKVKAFEDDIVDEKTSENVQEGSTVTRKVALKNMLQFIRLKFKSLVEPLQNTPGAFNEFYPQLLKEYNNAKKGDWEILIPRYLKTAQKYESLIGKDFVPTFTTLSKAYSTAASEQSTKINTTKNNNKDVSGTRKELTMQLTRNVIKIALDNVADKTVVNKYFDESLLRNKKKSTKGKNPPTEPPKSI